MSDDKKSSSILGETGAIIVSSDMLKVIPPDPTNFFVDDPELATFVEAELNNSPGIKFGHDLGFEDIINILSYLMYAMERPDWKSEFIQALEMSYDEEARQVEQSAKSKAPHLKVIK
tara:strand:- start:33 stop:383 length:351 start_codon:yes stop_codon:yes gene_type:complete